MAPYANLTEADLAEIDRLIKAARYDIEQSDRRTKRAKGILTKAHYYLLNGPESQNHQADNTEQDDSEDLDDTSVDPENLSSDGASLVEPETADAATAYLRSRGKVDEELPASFKEAMTDDS